MRSTKALWFRLCIDDCKVSRQGDDIDDSRGVFGRGDGSCCGELATTTIGTASKGVAIAFVVVAIAFVVNVGSFSSCFFSALSRRSAIRFAASGPVSRR